ncbi:glycosyltransferase family 2 protein [Glutamicibacter bergerei]
MAIFTKISNKLKSTKLVTKPEPPQMTVPEIMQPEPVDSPRHEIFISVVIPVYNAMPYLTELLNSLEAQDLAHEFYEVIAVDDGSSDFGGEILDVYAKRNSNFRVMHQENSGWAGKPRNVGLDLARGEYVFFVDSDDTLGSEALRRMRDFALEHGSDALAPKLVPTGGRAIYSALFAQTLIDTPLDVILTTLMPQKMIRKSLLTEHQIRFREDKVRLEDGMAMVEAYCVAKRISELADYDYYFLRTREDGQNISSRAIDPRGYVESLSHIASTVRSRTDNDKDYQQKLLAGLFKRKALRFYLGKRFLNYKPAKQQGWIKAHQGFINEYLPTNRDAVFNRTDLAKTEAIVVGNVGELKRLAKLDLTSSERPKLAEVSTTDHGFILKIDTPADGPKPVGILVKERSGIQEIRSDVSAASQPGQYVATLSVELMLADLTEFGDIFLEYQGEKPRRIRFPEGIVEGYLQGTRIYRTIKGSLSVDVRNAQR